MESDKLAFLFDYLSCTASFLLIFPIIKSWKLNNFFHEFVNKRGLISFKNYTKKLDNKILEVLDDSSSSPVEKSNNISLLKKRKQKLREFGIEYRKELEKTEKRYENIDRFFIICCLIVFLSILSEMHHYITSDSFILSNYKTYWLVSLICSSIMYIKGVKNRYVAFYIKEIQGAFWKKLVLVLLCLPFLILFSFFYCEFLFFIYPLISLILIVVSLLIIESYKIYFEYRRIAVLL